MAKAPAYKATTEDEALVHMALEKKRSIPALRAGVKARIESETQDAIDAVTREVKDIIQTLRSRGMPITIIQRDILKTSDWNAWTKWSTRLTDEQEAEEW